MFFVINRLHKSDDRSQYLVVICNSNVLEAQQLKNRRKYRMKTIAKVIYILASVFGHFDYLRNICKLAFGQIEKPDFQ